MARIFLCYTRADEAQVRGIYDRLQGLGYEPWMDKEDLIPGQNWQREIPLALKASALVLVCLSPNSAGRGYRQREFKLAVDALQEMPEEMIHTIPVRLEMCEVPELFTPLQWCDLFEPNGFERLVSAIRYGLQQRGEAIPEPPAVDLPESQSRASVTLPTTPFQILTNSIGMELILIPAGTFMMGSPDSDRDAYDDEKPAPSVTISQPFYFGKYPVTQAQWQAVMGNNPSRFQGEDRPVETVSWEDTQAFMQKLNERENSHAYRLPTEAEWEYACRARTTTRYHFGDDDTQLGEYAWYDENSGGETHPVGRKQPNAWGLYDMHGNVWEWCHDWDGPYSAGAVIDPSGPDTGAGRVIRGGGWSYSARHARSAYRGGLPPGDRYDDLGFRCLSAVKSGTME